MTTPIIIIAIMAYLGCGIIALIIFAKTSTKEDEHLDDELAAPLFIFWPITLIVCIIGYIIMIPEWLLNQLKKDLKNTSKNKHHDHNNQNHSND